MMKVHLLVPIDLGVQDESDIHVICSAALHMTLIFRRGTPWKMRFPAVDMVTILAVQDIDSKLFEAIETVFNAVVAP